MALASFYIKLWIKKNRLELSLNKWGYIISITSIRNSYKKVVIISINWNFFLCLPLTLKKNLYNIDYLTTTNILEILIA